MTINRFVSALAVFAIAFIVYLPSARYGMVGLDDYEYVYMNGRVMSGLSFDNVRWSVTSCGYANNWHPLTWISLQADASLVRDRPEALSAGLPDKSFAPLSSVMHIHNALLHAANATLLFMLIILMLKRITIESAMALPTAAFFALLWALHPLRTEVVCWISERKELLSVLFMLLTMIAYVSGRRFRHLVALPLYALALAAKPVAVTLPVVLFAWDWVMTGRRLGRSLMSVAPYLVLAAGAGVLTLVAQGEPLDVGMQFSIWEKIVMSLTAPVIYLRQTIWPVGLSAFYPSKPPMSWFELCLGVALLAGATAVCSAWLARRRSFPLSLLVIAVAWCLVSLVPMLGIVKVGDQPHSDRYTYWVGCGLAAVAALAVVRCAPILKRQGLVMSHKKSMVLIPAAILVILAFITRCRLPVWKDVASLYLDAVPKSWNQQAVCALSSILRGRGEEGKRQAEAMLRAALTKTQYLGVRAEFAHLLACEAKVSGFYIGNENPAFAEARYEAQSVLSASPENSLANEALAIIEMKEGRYADAIKHLNLARAETKDVERIDRLLSLCRQAVRKKGTSQ